MIQIASPFFRFISCRMVKKEKKKRNVKIRVEV